LILQNEGFFSEPKKGKEGGVRCWALEKKRNGGFKLGAPQLSDRLGCGKKKPGVEKSLQKITDKGFGDQKFRRIGGAKNSPQLN